MAVTWIGRRYVALKNTCLKCFAGRGLPFGSVVTFAAFLFSVVLAHEHLRQMFDNLATQISRKRPNRQNLRIRIGDQGTSVPRKSESCQTYFPDDDHTPRHRTQSEFYRAFNRRSNPKRFDNLVGYITKSLRQL